MIYKSKYFSGHGGLVIYLRDTLDFKILDSCISTTWENQFVEVCINGSKNIILVIFIDLQKPESEPRVNYSKHSLKNLIPC